VKEKDMTGFAPALRLVAVGAVLLLASCGGPPDRSADKARLMQASRDWSSAAASRNVDAIVDYWADDAVVIPAGAPELRGKAAIRTYIQQSLKLPGFHIEWEPIEANVSADGSMGYLIERTQLKMKAPDGSPVEMSYRGVTIWRKQADGGWKNIVDITNAPPPVAAAGAGAP
jgi:uncharacterized protein (TIGR02246 family)